MTLHQLFEEYGTDKANHGYAKVYEPLLHDRRDTVLRVLEIGIGTMLPDVPFSMVDYVPEHYRPGGSLRAWRDYFPNATIWGLDVRGDTLFDEPRIVTKLADSTNKAALDSVLGAETFDLIIDDGNHYPAAQRITLRNLWDRVNPGGFYVIEDILGFHTDETLMVIPK